MGGGEAPEMRGNLVDPFGRTMESLRISVNGRCDLACGYCNAAVKDQAAGGEAQGGGMATPREYARLAGLFAGMGVAKIRLTGGEPLLRSDLPDIVGAIRSVDGVDDLAMTTNGVGLAALAGELRKAGLNRVNISIDTLDRESFRVHCGRDALEAVLAGVRAAVEAGLNPVRLNAVVIRGVNDRELVRLVEFARAEGAVMRFIELMPVGIGGTQWSDGFVPLPDIMRGLAPLLEGSRQPEGKGPARYLPLKGGGEVGIVSSVSKPFCRECGRLRLTVDGRLRTCMTVDPGVDLLAMARGGADDGAMRDAITGAVAGKPERGDWKTAVRPMVQVGG